MNPVSNAPVSEAEEQPDVEHHHPGIGITQLLGIGLLVFSIVMVIMGIIMIFFMSPLGEP